MTKSKTCTKCGELKPFNEFNKDKSKKDDKSSHCRECEHKKGKKYRQENPEKISKRARDYYENGGGRERKGCISMYENKNSAQYLGIVIGERLCRHLFKDVEVMPHNNPGYDIICNKGKKIDIKTSCRHLTKYKGRFWSFTIDNNTVADYFVCVAFDNRTDLNPLHIWMIPGKEVNNQTTIQISLSTIHKWDKWERDINDAQLCCTEMKNKRTITCT